MMSLNSRPSHRPADWYYVLLSLPMIVRGLPTELGAAALNCQPLRGWIALTSRQLAAGDMRVCEVDRHCSSACLADSTPPLPRSLIVRLPV